MFDRKKTVTSEDKSEAPAAAVEKKPAPVPAPASAPKPASTSAPAPVAANDGKTVIGQQISIEGDIHGHENLVIEGSMKGKISLEKHQVTVGAKGRVEGEIHADNVTISGQLIGNISSSGKVKITKEADFSGEIKAKSISVEDGAYLKAVIELERTTQKVIPSIGKAAREEVKAPIPPSMAAGKAN